MSKVLEAVIAILMVLVVYILVYSAIFLPPDFESINIRLKTFYALQSLDANNELRTAVLNNDTFTLSQKLQATIPSNINYNVSICSSSCVAPVINSTRIDSVNYIISGDYGNFTPRQVVVYLWS